MLIQIVIILKLYISIKSYEYNEYNEYKPIIGIYGIPNPENEKEKINETYYPGSIIRFLDSFGAEIIAIHYWYDDTLIYMKFEGVALPISSYAKIITFKESSYIAFIYWYK